MPLVICNGKIIEGLTLENSKLTQEQVMQLSSFRQGRYALFHGGSTNDNPYHPNTLGYKRWTNGYFSPIHMSEKQVVEAEYEGEYVFHNGEYLRKKTIFPPDDSIKHLYTDRGEDLYYILKEEEISS